jgi:hypothetical protein
LRRRREAEIEGETPPSTEGPSDELLRGCERRCVTIAFASEPTPRRVAEAKEVWKGSPTK